MIFLIFWFVVVLVVVFVFVVVLFVVVYVEMLKDMFVMVMLFDEFMMFDLGEIYELVLEEYVVNMYDWFVCVDLCDLLKFNGDVV